jgi:transcriptional regulator with XRE-family HTH domain
MLELHRQNLNLSQAHYAARLGVSQPYLSLLESGRRPVTEKLRKKLAEEFGADPTQMPLALSETEMDDDTLANALGRLGYPGFAHLDQGPLLNPAVLVLECLRKGNTDVRVVEGLPWLLSRYDRLDVHWLCNQVKLLNLQNQLGFLVALAVEVRPAAHLAQLLEQLEPARLAAEAPLANRNMPANLRAWLRTERSRLAEHWNLLTKLDAAAVGRWFEEVHVH